MTHDGCDVQQGCVDVGRAACVHNHMTVCTPWYKCLQLMTTLLQPAEAGTDDASVPAAPTIQYTTYVTSHYYYYYYLLLLKIKYRKNLNIIRIICTKNRGLVARVHTIHVN